MLISAKLISTKNMITAHHNKFADLLFRVYILRLFRKHFYSFHLLGEPPTLQPQLPLLLLPNHSSWWDGFFVYLLNIKLWQRQTFLMMLEEQLKKNLFFRYLGAYSINPHSTAKVRESFRYTLEILKTFPKECTVCIFPQGELLPWGQRPFAYKPGIIWLLNRVNKPIQILQLAIRIEMLAQQRPEVFFLFSPLQYYDKSLTLEQLQANHEQLLNRLAEKLVAKEKGIQLMAGKPSVNERLEKWRRLLSKG